MLANKDASPMTGLHRLALMIFGLAALASGAAAQPPSPATPPAPWFTVADIPSHDAAIAATRWLWNREIRTLRYCRQSRITGKFACAPDVVLPDGRWVLDRIQAQPSDGVESDARFYSPDRDQTLHCAATTSGDFGCE